MPSSIHKNVLLVIVIAVPFLVIWNLRTFELSYEKLIQDVGNIGKVDKSESNDNVEENPLDGCSYVYLDMGTNIGQQIR